jgi:16S rRNA (cytidine1402-2'-O)-methyltransferase
MGDISARAIEALARCDAVLCEDTRVCGKLLGHFGISKKMIVYRDDGEAYRVPKIVKLLLGGSAVCLTTDAGTPTISDPGYRIVNACRQHGIPIEVIPGPCAATAVLAASGLPSDGFLFLGFLPSKSSARINAFKKYTDFDYSLVFYESCHRILKFLDDLRGVVGDDRVVCVAKEVTKFHEKFYVGKVGEVFADVSKSSPMGEYVAVVAPWRFSWKSA